MRSYVLEDAGPDALVLVDELGKGTEARAGTALAAAFLERLAQDGCRGMFATCASHQSVVPLPAELQLYSAMPAGAWPTGV